MSNDCMCWVTRKGSRYTTMLIGYQKILLSPYVEAARTSMPLYTGYLLSILLSFTYFIFYIHVSSVPGIARLPANVHKRELSLRLDPSLSQAAFIVLMRIKLK